MNASLLLSQAHEEYCPQSFLEGLSKAGIAYDVHPEALTSLDELQKYTSLALIKPKIPPSAEEAEVIRQYKENKGGVMLVVDLPDPLDYEKFKQGDVLTKLLFDAELVNTRILPTTGIERSKGNQKWQQEIETHYMGLRLTIKSTDQSYVQGMNKQNIRLIEDDIDFITSFSGGGIDKRVIIERDVDSSVYTGPFIEYKASVFEKCYEEVRMKIVRNYENVGIVSDTLKRGRAVGFSTSRLFDEIENDGEQAKKCQDFINEYILWISKPAADRLKIFRDEKTEKIKSLEEQLMTANQEIARLKDLTISKPSTTQEETVLISRSKSLTPLEKCEEIEKIIGRFYTSQEMTLKLWELAAILVGDYGDKDTAKKVVNTSNRIEDNVLPQRGLKEPDTIIFEADVIKVLNEVNSRQNWYAKHSRT